MPGNKFLLVLDDVWNKDYGLHGDIRPYTLKTLPNNEGFQLFSKHALQAENFDTHPHLKLMADEIVRQCKGLPLAIKTFRGLLREKFNKQSWESILNSRI